ncbi:hypothetical protein P5673_018059 [Acropora cervicornis]|uniref:Uncharacterized protein n=1 Tax=Acropora cervicornis TaxID=6130 RepID=A0AAD9V330_ACRCE|nr:hypothetical protein P5673_018059 [Acropora cervicornis]
MSFLSTSPLGSQQLQLASKGLHLCLSILIDMIFAAFPVGWLFPLGFIGTRIPMLHLSGRLLIE